MLEQTLRAVPSLCELEGQLSVCCYPWSCQPTMQHTNPASCYVWQLHNALVLQAASTKWPNTYCFQTQTWFNSCAAFVGSKFSARRL